MRKLVREKEGKYISLGKIDRELGLEGEMYKGERERERKKERHIKRGVKML